MPDDFYARSKIDLGQDKNNLVQTISDRTKKVFLLFDLSTKQFNSVQNSLYEAKVYATVLLFIGSWLKA